MTKPILTLTEMCREGDAALERLKRARSRDDVAHWVRTLRDWHRDLQPPAEAYSPPLAESLRKMNPHPEEWARVADALLSGRYIGEAQRLLLLTTATALYRLAPHLAKAGPVRKEGRTKLDDDAAVAKARELVRLGDTKWAAANKVEHFAARGTTPGANVRRVYGKLDKV